MSFTPAELRVLEAADQLVDQMTPAERNRLHSAESVARRIQRVGIDEWKRIRREAVARWKAKRQGSA